MRIVRGGGHCTKTYNTEVGTSAKTNPGKSKSGVTVTSSRNTREGWISKARATRGKSRSGPYAHTLNHKGLGGIQNSQGISVTIRRGSITHPRSTFGQSLLCCHTSPVTFACFASGMSQTLLLLLSFPSVAKRAYAEQFINRGGKIHE
jgi:hypothetical protein